MSAHRAFRLAVEYPHIVDSGQFFGQWFEANVRSPWVEDMTWFRNGVFGVSRDGILSRPRGVLPGSSLAISGQTRARDRSLHRAFMVLRIQS